MLNKYYNDKGEVAVLVSGGYGAGWFTWNTDEQLLFSPELVQAILDETPRKELEAIAKKLFPDSYCGGADQLHIEWVKPGTRFRIEEYDGAESFIDAEELVLIA